MAQTIFERYESKYMLSTKRCEALMAQMQGKMAEDKYGSYTVSNLYYDTPSFELVRASIEKPAYKEKLRLRCYGAANEDALVFLELKKKYKGIVYKRRVRLSYREAKDFLANKPAGGTADRQILSEIAHFLSFYPVAEKVLLCYERMAFTGIEDEELRITFDRNIRFRQEQLSFNGDTDGAAILEPDNVLMEIKTAGAIPRWLSRALSVNGIFPTSFSKYGTCYTRYIADKG